MLIFRGEGIISFTVSIRTRSKLVKIILVMICFYKAMFGFFAVVD